MGVDHHVVEHAGGLCRQVGVHRQRAVGLPAKDSVVTHRHDQQATVLEPAQSRGLRWYMRLHEQQRGRAAGGRDGGRAPRSADRGQTVTDGRGAE